MDFEKIIDSLHPLERKVLPFLDKSKSVSDIVKLSSFLEVEVMRALSWLQAKGILTTRDSYLELAVLDVNGKAYLEHKLPERRLLEILSVKPHFMDDLQKILEPEELNVAIGQAKRNQLIVILDRKLSLSPIGKNLLNSELPSESLLKILGSGIEFSKFSEDQKSVFNQLKSRKQIVDLKILKSVEFSLTSLGKQLLAKGLSFENVVDNITIDTLKSGGWQGKKFRSFDVSMPVPPLNFGKKHHYKKYLDSVREKFITLGFEEMIGPIIESDFWDMDALFMPQFHSARDIHQAYYVKEPAFDNSIDINIIKRVQAAHENGFNTGSKGWRYDFDIQKTRRHLLRTQGTAVSSRTMASPDLKIPGKYFSIAKCFRYDIIDSTHLPDFFQVEGIVVEEGLTFAHLKGLLTLFAKEFANTADIRIKPGYFPFTEPSCELHAKHPDLGWIELGGAGIFRPELTAPLGVKVPVIAWGIGIDRLGMFKMGINDIRDLYSKNIEFLRDLPVI